MIESKPFVQTQLIAVVMDMPAHLPLVVKNTIKQIIENRSHSIVGVNANIRNRNRFAPLFPEFILNETANRDVEQFVTEYMCVDTFEIDVMFIEPDPSFNEVRRSWMCRRMKLDSFTAAPAERHVGTGLPRRSSVHIRFESQDTTHPFRDPSITKAAEAIYKQMQVASNNPLYGPRGTPGVRLDQTQESRGMVSTD